MFKDFPNFKLDQSEKIKEDTFAGTRGFEPISELVRTQIAIR
jgi:hypothetical protein